MKISRKILFIWTMTSIQNEKTKNKNLLQTIQPDRKEAEFVIQIHKKIVNNVPKIMKKKMFQN